MVDLNTLVSNPSDVYLTEANYITEEGIVANGLLRMPMATLRF